MFYNCDLETIAKQAFADHLWQNENPDPSWIKGKFHTVWKNKKFTLIEKIFREIKSLETSLANTLLSRKFGQKSAIVNFRNFNTVFWLYSAPNY